MAKLEKIWKSYGGIAVLKGVSIDLQPGEIHALVGGNGAGKSTLMKIVTGVVTPDSGKIVIAGNEVRNLSPRAAHSNGVYLVPQEPELFPNLSVYENIQLAMGDLKIPRTRVEEVTKSLCDTINLDSRASDLSISDQQLVEIIRGVLRGAHLLIVDEPTSSLTAKEAQRLFTHLRAFAQSGVGIFYVTHRMAEIFELCDRVTVLRDGNTVLQKNTQNSSIAELVGAMVPQQGNTTTIHQRQQRETDRTQKPALSVRNFTGDGFAGINFDLYPGEVLGIAGVIGAGRTELAESIYGVRKGLGTVTLNGADYAKRTPQNSLRKGLSYVPEDRHEHGVFLLGTIVDNTTSGILERISRLGILDHKADKATAEEFAADLSLQQGSLQRHVGNLSGGNQQKVSLAKALAANPQVIILDEPSRGIDVAARADLYRLVEGLAERGLAVLLISSEFEEIELLSTRVLVMRDGHIAEEFSGDDINFGNIRDAAFGANESKKTA
ncbi:sugar ABC transporter ATP-binding protein [Timonella sp. A28]|uniref:sugar ABC transporter ATP-binding protein n=1 Tax=Timonella sp. A28 TaxID=3442640 RepID=UPI003EBA5A12